MKHLCTLQRTLYFTPLFYWQVRHHLVLLLVFFLKIRFINTHSHTHSCYLFAFPSPCSRTLIISGSRWAGSLGLSRYNKTFLPYLLVMTSSRDDKISWTGESTALEFYTSSSQQQPLDIRLTESTACLTSLVSSTQSNIARRTRWPNSPWGQKATYKQQEKRLNYMNQVCAGS